MKYQAIATLISSLKKTPSEVDRNRILYDRLNIDILFTKNVAAYKLPFNIVQNLDVMKIL